MSILNKQDSNVCSRENLNIEDYLSAGPRGLTY